MVIAGTGLSSVRPDGVLPMFAHEVLPIVGICMAIAWFVTVRGYNEVLEAKFSILHCIENNLPLAIYKTEWDILSSSYKKLHRASKVDSMVPAFFIVLYVIIFIFVK